MVTVNEINKRLRRLTAAVLLGCLSVVMPEGSACFSQDAVKTRGVSRATLTDCGFMPEKIGGIPGLIETGIAAGKMPGCVVCFGRQGKIAYLEAFGNRSVQPTEIAMTTDTVFDMASITKPVATATSIMTLVEAGKLRLGDKVSSFFPEFAANGKDSITVQDCLIHQSGLIPDNKLSDYDNGPDAAWEKICELGLVAPVGEVFKYSDVNFIVLAKLVEQLSGANVHEYSQAQIFKPLGMSETGYLPSESLRARAAVTEQRDGTWMRGEVHDPRAFQLGGIAGHAGLFSTAQDMAIYASMMLGRGALSPLGSDDGNVSSLPTVEVLSPLTWDRMTRGYRVSGGVRGLGWDKQTAYSSNKGDLLSASAFGHGGFTGTVLWIDPELDLFFIFLSNRVHPTGTGSVNHLAGKILNVVASALVEAPAASEPRTAPVLTGVDVLQRDGFRQLHSQRVGLITNHTGRNAAGKSTAALLQQSSTVELTALFSPEHGLEGKLDIANIEDSADDATGLKVFSLYGQTRRPTEEMLQSVDTLVFDIQDIGTRFYTYISTMGEAMIAASEAKKRFVVLDRPNPIGGEQVMGPMLDAGLESFVGFHSLPVRHGMTIGEIALMLRSELKLDLDLQVIECEGWRRENAYETTGLTWINPSPNMRNLTQAFLYPGVGLLEMTNVSVGRGTDTPFEVLGAPWIEGKQLAAALNACDIPGVAFVPIEFTPNASKFESELCGGVQICLLNRSTMEPVRVGIEIAVTLRRLFQDDWDTENLNRLLGNQAVESAIVAGADFDALEALVHADVPKFLARRSAFLIYE